MNFAVISDQTGGLLWIVWFVSNVLIVLGSFAYFRIYPNVTLRRRFHRGFIIANGAVLFLLVFLSIGAWWPMLLFGAAIIFITYLNIRNAIFCDACGKTTHNNSWFDKVEFCAKCGARLPQKH